MFLFAKELVTLHIINKFAQKKVGSLSLGDIFLPFLRLDQRSDYVNL